MLRVFSISSSATIIVSLIKSSNKVFSYSFKALYLKVINVLSLLSSYKWPFSLGVIRGFILLVKALSYCFKVSYYLNPYLKSFLISLNLLPVSDNVSPINK